MQNQPLRPRLRPLIGAALLLSALLGCSEAMDNVPTGMTTMPSPSPSPAGSGEAQGGAGSAGVAATPVGAGTMTNSTSSGLQTPAAPATATAPVSTVTTDPMQPAAPAMAPATPGAADGAPAPANAAPTDAAPTDAAPTDAAPTCSSSAGELTPGMTQETIMVDGTSRSFWLAVPAAYDGSTPVPFIIEFHGLGLDGATMRDAFSTLKAVAERENIIVAWPDGLDKAWNVGPCCTRERSVDDVGFARAMVDFVAERGCVDRTRVYATGYSNGGGMSYAVACGAADVFAAVAPAAFDLLEESTCQPSRPISVFSFRGTADPIVLAMPHESTPPTELISGFALPPIHFLGPEGTFMRWSQLNGCAGMPTAGADGCSTYESCEAGVEVTLCLTEGGGHDPADGEQVWKSLSRFTLP